MKYTQLDFEPESLDHSSKYFDEWDCSELGRQVAIDLFWENMWVEKEVLSEIKFRFWCIQFS
jgi:hypothetical protein